MAVSIWEGKKAEDLIEAVKNSGLSDGVKNALLEIAQNVVYQNQNGQTYYNNLYNALYQGEVPIDPTLVYHLEQAKTINTASDGINTGLLIGSDYTFTILMDFELNASSETKRRIASGNTLNPTNEDQYFGINFMSNYQQSAYKLTAAFNTSDSFSVAYDNSVNHRIKYVCRYDSTNRSYSAVVFVDGLKALDMNQTVTVLGTPSIPLCIGARIGDGEMVQPMLGTMYICDVYNRVLANNEAEQILGVTL